MSEIPITERMTLRLKVRQTTTVLPRCLQILSRRGFYLTHLDTETNDSDIVVTMTVQGPSHWQAALPRLLARLIDVYSVTVIEGGGDE